MASLSVPYESTRSTYQHLIWFTLDWIHRLHNCPQLQKVVKPIREYFCTRNRKLYALINNLQCVTAARKKGLVLPTDQLVLAQRQLLLRL